MFVTLDKYSSFTRKVCGTLDILQYHINTEYPHTNDLLVTVP